MAAATSARALALACLACALAPAAAAARDRCPAVAPAPTAATPATPQRIDAYLRAVDAASPLVRTVVAGRSVEGRPLRYAIVTALSRPRLTAQLAALRAIRSGQARSTIHLPAVVWIAGSVHGNEPSGADADLQLLHDLAANCRDARLRRLVIAIIPVQNPDGRRANTRVNAAGFDLNRDWFARTQPETEARVQALLALPPLVFVDQHEQGGTRFALPPYAAPLHHELPRAARHAIDDVFAPALRAALPPSSPRGELDLFYPGYGDSATALLFGAAGMTLEAGSAAPLAVRVAEHRAAAAAVIAAADRHRAALLQAWAHAFAEARAQGARGQLQGIVAAPVRGYALAPGSDALVQRLVSVGVRVQRLGTATMVAALQPYDSRGDRRAILPAGTFVISTAQPLKHWVEALLGPDSHLLGLAYSDDVSAWSNPLLMGLAGGLIRSAPPHGQPVSAAPTPPPPERSALAARAPRVALLADVPPTTAPAGARQSSASAAWAQWVLEQRFGLRVAVVTAEQIAAGALVGRTHLVVPDGERRSLSPETLGAVAAFVRAGGVYVGWRTRGLTIAHAAGLTNALPASPAAIGLSIPGAAVQVELDPMDPLADGLQRAVVMDTDDPAIVGGDHVVATYPRGGLVSGFGAGLTLLAGRPAALDEPFGAGRALLLAFDPCFRGYADGSARLLANALLA